mgnify:CR=1 FL=1
MSKLNDLENIVVLKSDTYDCSGSSYENQEQPKFKTPFENQNTYGQRYTSKQFDKQEDITKAQDYYEKRPILSDDMSVNDLQEHQNYYHHPFPTSENNEIYTKNETFITHPYDSPQNAEDTWSSGFIPVGGPIVPDTVENFSVKETFDKHKTIIIVIIVLIILFIGFGIFMYRKYLYKKYGSIRDIKDNISTMFKNKVESFTNSMTKPISDDDEQKIKGGSTIDYIPEDIKLTETNVNDKNVDEQADQAEQEEDYEFYEDNDEVEDNEKHNLSDKPFNFNIDNQKNDDKVFNFKI